MVSEIPSFPVLSGGNGVTTAHFPHFFWGEAYDASRKTYQPATSNSQGSLTARPQGVYAQTPFRAIQYPTVKKTFRSEVGGGQSNCVASWLVKTGGNPGLEYPHVQLKKYIDSFNSGIFNSKKTHLHSIQGSLSRLLMLVDPSVFILIPTPFFVSPFPARDSLAPIPLLKSRYTPRFFDFRHWIPNSPIWCVSNKEFHWNPGCLINRDPYHHGFWNNPQKNWVGVHPQPIYPKQTGTFSLLNCGSKMVQNFRGVSGSVIPYIQKKNQPGCWSLLMWSGRFLIQIMVLAWQFPTVLHIFCSYSAKGSWNRSSNF